MTPRERVRLALNHKLPDRVPIDNNSIISGIREVANANHLERLGVQENVALQAEQRITLNSEMVQKSLGVNTRYLYPSTPSRKNTIADSRGRIYNRSSVSIL